ncbi:MAG: hypothetical protein ACLQLG_16465 [Thermoguttaceae bacterium]
MAMLALLLALPGCRGCRHTETPEETEKREAEERAKMEREKEKPKEDFEMKRLAAWPSAEYSVGEGDHLLPVNLLKPGHWTSIVLADAKMNNFDFLGDWEMTVLDHQKNDRPVSVPATPYTLTTTRAVALPKGQAKTLESLLLVPPGYAQVRMSYQLRGRKIIEASSGLQLMPAHQYHFVVLARWPTSYTYLRALPSIQPTKSIGLGEHSAYYRVTLAPPKGPPPLPSHALLWTSIAYVLWDDADPGLLDADQQQALLDWLHWGGQLILSGPDTLDTLRSSFLAPYLPATSAGARDLRARDLAELSEQWTPAGGRRLAPVKPWAGIRLKKDARARFLPDSGDLLVERAVGRGRIVASAFRLSSLDLIDWPGWDGVLNGCLLRRPQRDFRLDPDPNKTEGVHWADTRAHPDPWDPALSSRLRFFARDAAVVPASHVAKAQQGNRFGNVPNGGQVYPTQGDDPSEGDDGSGETFAPVGTGVAAWNDFNPVANAARQGLQQAAGIKVLDRMFVVWIVACYVLVLVPLNWGVFRLLGRVEWAWAAAPLIAVACAAVVINVAKLDIGFVRSENEIAVVELQGDYPRAHVTRYAALYTSLSTGYGFRFESPDSMMLPFPTDDDPGRFRMLLGESYRNLTCRRGDDLEVAGYAVGSNSTGFIHGEQWINLDHPLVLTRQDDEGLQIVNQTQLTLRDAGVIKRTAGGGLQTAWLGTIAAGATASGKFDLESPSLSGGDLWKRQRDLSPQTCASIVPGELNLHGLLEIAQRSEDLRPGEIRLVAWSDDPLPGLVVEPAAKQWQHAALVVAHLTAGDEDLPRPDLGAPPRREASPSETDESFVPSGATTMPCMVPGLSSSAGPPPPDALLDKPAVAPGPPSRLLSTR